MGELLDNPKAVMDYWRARYLETYGVDYVPSSWPREMSQIKSKLLKTYQPDVLKRLIDVVLRLYERKWKSGGYLRPTIGQLSGWLGVQALPLAQADTNEPTMDEHFDNGQELLAELLEKGWV